MAQAFEQVGRFVKYRVCKIRKMLEIGCSPPSGSIQKWQEVGHFWEKTKYGKLELHFLISDLKSEIFIKRCFEELFLFQTFFTFISHVVSGFVAWC